MFSKNDAPRIAAKVAAGPVSAQVSTNTHFTDRILRGGLNYRFY
jgi:hypothetical protein